jgi:hypothetical protein
MIPPVTQTSRREFLQIGLTVAAWPVATAAPAAGIEPASRLPLLGVVCDTRFPASTAFGERSAALGLRTLPIAGDMTHLWFDEIHPRWQQWPVALAGLTAHGPLFCFAELARDVGMRVVFRAEHRGLYAWVIAPPNETGIEGVSGWLFPQV